MESTRDRSPSVEGGAGRVGRRSSRGALAAKRALDVLLAATMLVAVVPLLALAGLLLGGAGARGWLEGRICVGRDGEPIRLLRFRELPGMPGRALARIGVRELPLLLCVLAGRLSFVGPRALPPDAQSGDALPRRQMAPGLTGPAQRWATDGRSAGELDDAYVSEWSLWRDLRMLAGIPGRAPRPASAGAGD